MDINQSDIITIKQALSIAADSLLEQAGWCGDNASEEELRYDAEQFHALYNKLELKPYDH